jgi:tetratricopeptide (TPR) repeat protein
LLALGYYQGWVLRDRRTAEATFVRVSKMLPGNSEVLLALSRIKRGQERWDESIAYFEQALALDPRNIELLMDAASAYAELRRFPTALKLYDRVLDIRPNHPDVMALRARVYQAQGNLEEAARLLSQVNWQTPNQEAVNVKIIQLTLQRNYSELMRLLQARQAQFHFNSEYEKSSNQIWLALTQLFAGDTVGATVTAQEACNVLEQLYKDQPNNGDLAISLSRAYAVLGEKNLALKVADHVNKLGHAKGLLIEHSTKEHLATIQTMVGENSRAISILSALLQVPYWSPLYGPPAITAALLRLDPIWDPLRGDPAFQKLCEEKQDPTTNGH